MFTYSQKEWEFNLNLTRMWRLGQTGYEQSASEKLFIDSVYLYHNRS
jgi:hypothetical protein